MKVYMPDMSEYEPFLTDNLSEDSIIWLVKQNFKEYEIIKNGDDLYLKKL